MAQLAKRIISSILIVLGLTVLFYPSVSEFLIEKNASRAVDRYDEMISKIDAEKIDAAFRAAEEYNRLLVSGKEKGDIPDDKGNPVTLDSYNDLLSLTGNGQMGYISIPALNETIPVYHGTDESVMQTGIGHIQGTSLPVGGNTTHAVLTGHRGLPLANLFTNLDQIKKGDKFFLRIMNKTLCYQVDRIVTVLPDDVSGLDIEEGKDFVTLVTCTPYGVNSHRLLVRGKRTAFDESEMAPAGYRGGLKAFWNRLPMQYRHLLLGIAILLFLVAVRKFSVRFWAKRGEAHE